MNAKFRYCFTKKDRRVLENIGKYCTTTTAISISIIHNTIFPGNTAYHIRNANKIKIRRRVSNSKKKKKKRWNETTKWSELKWNAKAEYLLTYSFYLSSILPWFYHSVGITNVVIRILFVILQRNVCTMRDIYHTFTLDLWISLFLFFWLLFSVLNRWTRCAVGMEISHIEVKMHVI